jgi:hypothetical protein
MTLICLAHWVGPLVSLLLVAPAFLFSAAVPVSLLSVVEMVSLPLAVALVSRPLVAETVSLHLAVLVFLSFLGRALHPLPYSVQTLPRTPTPTSSTIPLPLQ